MEEGEEIEIEKNRNVKDERGGKNEEWRGRNKERNVWGYEEWRRNDWKNWWREGIRKCEGEKKV